MNRRGFFGLIGGAFVAGLAPERAINFHAYDSASDRLHVYDPAMSNMANLIRKDWTVTYSSAEFVEYRAVGPTIRVDAQIMGRP